MKRVELCARLGVVRRPVVVVGAGPVGLSLAIDLAQREVPVILLDNDCSLSAGSRAAAADPVPCRMVPGAAATDAPVCLADGRSTWLLRHLGADFTALVRRAPPFNSVVADLRRAAEGSRR